LKTLEQYRAYFAARCTIARTAATAFPTAVSAKSLDSQRFFVTGRIERIRVLLSRRIQARRSGLPVVFTPRQIRGRKGMAEAGSITARREGRVGYVIFDNPERHNAVSLAMWDDVSARLGEFASDPTVGVVVLTGAGNKSFVSGADISRFEDERGSAQAVSRYSAAVEQAYSTVHDFPKPTIAMIRGYCIGGGLGLAVSCDIRIASTHARFAMPAARLGLGYDFAGMRRFVEVLGPSVTKELFFTARQFDAEEARVMGLANRVVPDREIEADVAEYAGMIAGNAPLTLASVKFIVGQVLRDESQRDLKRCTELVQQCFASRDYEEGRKAFMEKRKAVFTGN
jgi:enoyl-CoA hydratase/carnithine racemase